MPLIKHVSHPARWLPKTCPRPIILILLGLILLPATVAFSEALVGPEYEVKAGFIYNFMKFVRWPESSTEQGKQPLVLCFATNEPAVGNVLFKLDNTRIEDRTIKILQYDSTIDPKTCNVFYFATPDNEFTGSILSQIKHAGILTIGESEGFIEMGGIINFFVDNQRLRFQVNLKAAQQQGISFSSQLLRSAVIVP
jgi:hypothetical protein